MSSRLVVAPDSPPATPPDSRSRSSRHCPTVPPSSFALQHPYHPKCHHNHHNHHHRDSDSLSSTRPRDFRPSTYSPPKTSPFNKSRPRHPHQCHQSPTAPSPSSDHHHRNHHNPSSSSNPSSSANSSSSASSHRVKSSRRPFKPSEPIAIPTQPRPSPVRRAIGPISSYRKPSSNSHQRMSPSHYHPKSFPRSSRYDSSDSESDAI